MGRERGKPKGNNAENSPIKSDALSLYSFYFLSFSLLFFHPRYDVTRTLSSYDRIALKSTVSPFFFFSLVIHYATAHDRNLNPPRQRRILHASNSGFVNRFAWERFSLATGQITFEYIRDKEVTNISLPTILITKRIPVVFSYSKISL